MTNVFAITAAEMKIWDEIEMDMYDWEESEIKALVRNTDTHMLLAAVDELSTWDHPFAEVAMQELAENAGLDFDEYPTYDDLYDAIIVRNGYYRITA